MAEHLILQAKRVAVLRSELGENIVINQPVGYSVETLAERGAIDCVIADTEDGFSPLGQMRSFLSHDLGLNERNLVKYAMDGLPDTLEKNISSLADWNRFQRDEVTLVAIPSERHGSHLRGLILTPYDASLCYEKFAHPQYRARPHRDFMYNVTYEAIAHAYTHWGSRRIGMCHFARYGLHRDTTTCQIEAIAHFCSDHKGMESFTFMDYQVSEALVIVKEFNKMHDIGVHRPIATKSLQFWGIDFIDLEWRHLSK